MPKLYTLRVFSCFDEFGGPEYSVLSDKEQQFWVVLGLEGTADRLFGLFGAPVKRRVLASRLIQQPCNLKPYPLLHPPVTQEKICPDQKTLN